MTYYILTICSLCKSNFYAYKYNLQKGFGKYCSKKCSNSANPRGFKKGHGSFWTKKSRKKFRESRYGELHLGWKGEHASNVAKHAFIERHKGKPRECEHCGSKSRYKTYDWANVDHKYSRNLLDYIRLCRSCHRKYDIKNNNYNIDKLRRS